MVAEPVEEKQKQEQEQEQEQASSPAPGKKRRLRLLRRRRPQEAEALPQKESPLWAPSMTGWIIVAVLILAISVVYSLGLIPDVNRLLFRSAENPLAGAPLEPDDSGGLSETTPVQETTLPAQEVVQTPVQPQTEESGETAATGEDAVQTVAELYNAMPPATAGTLLATMDPEQAVAVLRQMRREQAAAVLAQMDPSDAAELIRLIMEGPSEGGG